MSEEKWWINKFNIFLEKSKNNKANAIAKVQDYVLTGAGHTRS